MSDELKQKLAADGTEPLASTPEEYAADIDQRGNQVVGDREEVRRQGDE